MPVVRLGHHDDWPTLGWDVVEWIEAYLCHGPGDVEGEPMLLDLEWVQFILDCYRLFPQGHPRAGERVVTRAVLSRPKGRAKSEIAGAIVCAEGVGPVRFAGWGADGNPIGKPVRSPFIRCLATEESQTGNTYDNVTVMLDYGAEHAPEVFRGVDIGKSTRASTRVYLPNGGEVRPSTASSAAKDGGKETNAVADETHLYYLPELTGMHAMVRRNCRKRKIAQPWMLDTTTMFKRGQLSVAEAMYDRVESILSGKRLLTAGFYFNHREGTAVEDWDDDAQILTSLYEAYGEASKAGWIDCERILSDDIRSPEATEADSRRYWLNQLHDNSGGAFDKARFIRLTDPAATIPDKAFVTIGFKGGRSDAAGLVVTDIATGVQLVANKWERDDDDPRDWEVPEDQLDVAVAAAFKRWNVWRLYGDPVGWESAMDRWAGEYGPKKVITWWTNRKQPMARALSAYRGAINRSEITHNGDESLSTHLGAARQVDQPGMKDDEGKPLWLIARMGKQPIALAVAACLSWEARGDAVAAGATPPKPAELVSF